MTLASFESSGFENSKGIGGRGVVLNMDGGRLGGQEAQARRIWL